VLARERAGEAGRVKRLKILAVKNTEVICERKENLKGKKFENPGERGFEILKFTTKAKSFSKNEG